MQSGKVAMEFSPTIGDIYNNVSSILHILRDFDRSMKPVNLAANAQKIEK